MDKGNNMDEGQNNDGIVKVHVLGTGSYTSERSFFPSFVIEYGGECTIVDPTANLSFALNLYRVVSGEDLSFRDLRQTCITHVHSDHAAGMVDLGVQKYYVEMKRRNYEQLVLFAPEEILSFCWRDVLKGTLQKTFEQVEPKYKMHNRKFEDFFKLVALKPGVKKRVGELEVTAKQGIHASPGGSFGYRFDCGGILIGYSGDTAPSVDGKGDLTGFIEDCDMIIYESGMSRIGGHTSYEFLEGKLTLEAQDRVYLTHYPDFLANDEDSIPFNLLKPGRCYVITKKGVEAKPVTEKGQLLLDIIAGN